MFRYFDEGEGPPTFVLVHGLPGSARDFRWLSPLLATEARAIRMELPGFGSTPLETEPSADVLPRARFVLHCVDALRLERPILVGHSMGGVVCAGAASIAPGRIAGLALIASPGLRVHRGFRQLPRHALSAVLRLPGMSRGLRRPLAAGFRRSGFRHSTHEERVHTLHCVARTSIPEHAARLRSLRMPLFHAFCEDDPLVEPAVTAHTATVLGGEVLRFATGGHNPQKHDAIELANELVQWSRSIVGSATASPP